MENTDTTISSSTVYLKTDNGITLFTISNIICFNIDNDEVIAMQHDEQIENVRHSLTELEHILPTAQFFRIHAKSLINLTHVRCYNHKTCCVTLSNNQKLIVACKRKVTFKHLLYNEIAHLSPRLKKK